MCYMFAVHRSCLYKLLMELYKDFNVDYLVVKRQSVFTVSSS